MKEIHKYYIPLILVIIAIAMFAGMHENASAASLGYDNNVIPVTELSVPDHISYIYGINIRNRVNRLNTANESPFKIFTSRKVQHQDSSNAKVNTAVNIFNYIPKQRPILLLISKLII